MKAMLTNYREKSRTVSPKQKIAHVALELVRILLGCVFVFSGFVKLIDPLGFSYKFDDYFRAFGGAFELLTHVSFLLAVLISVFEFVIGFCLIFKVQMRWASLSALVFMALMTPLTLYIALKNPVTDCGCFGDALVISNWATFYKNIVIGFFAFIVFITQAKFRSLFAPQGQNLVTAFFVLVGFALSFYCYRHLPLIDFLPYKVGVNIPQAMIVPEGAQKDKYVTTFIYQKNGIQKEFTLENYPKGDSTWKFVDQKTVVISEGEKAKIHDFSIVDSHFEDITESVLYDEGETYLLIMYDLTHASVEGAQRAEQIYEKAVKEGKKFYALTASSDADIRAFSRKYDLSYPFCKTDGTALKTIIRANPGLLLLKKGTIMEKWNWRDFE